MVHSLHGHSLGLTVFVFDSLGDTLLIYFLGRLIAILLMDALLLVQKHLLIWDKPLRASSSITPLLDRFFFNMAPNTAVSF